MSNPATMDMVAGAKILQQRFQATLHADQDVLHGDRRATFVRMNRGMAIIRYWGDSHAVSVPLETLSVPPPRRRSLRPSTGTT